MPKTNASQAAPQASAAPPSQNPTVDPSHDLTGLRAVLSSKRADGLSTMTPLEFLVYAESCEDKTGHVLSDMLGEIEAIVTVVKALLFAGGGDEKDEIDTVLWMMTRKVRAAKSLAEALTAEAAR